MGSLFGGAQTVPTTQNTFQNQTGTSYASNVSNPFATNVGEQATAFADILGAGGAQNVPLLNVLAPTAGVTQATNQLGQNASTINPLMGTAANNITQAGGYFPQASGFIGSGAGLAQQAGQGITSQDINSFLNPFTSNVTANLQDIFGQQNAQNLIGSTAAAGGAGSERSAVGQALLAQRQQLTAGNIYADLYQRSLQAAEQQKAQQLAAGQGLIGAGGATGALGSQLGQLGLGTAGAVNQTNALNLQGQYQYQNLLQQQQNALYQQQLGQYEDPFRRLAATSGAIYPMIGLGGAQTAGQNIGSAGFGTSATTFPAPPLGGQLAGLGLAGAALFAARGGRIKKKHCFDLGGAVDGGMSSPLGTEDMGDASAMGGQAAPMGLVGEGAPSGGTGSFGGQSDTEASPATMTTQQGQPISEQKAISSPSPEEKTLGKRNQYALMQALLKQSIGKQQQQMQAPRINWPQPLTMKQEGGRVSKFDTTTTNKFSPQAYLNPKDEETESAAHFRLTPNWGMSRRANPYFNAGDKNNLYSDMRDPGTNYPMMSGSRYPMSPPPPGEAAGLYADGGAVGDDVSPMAQAALSDDDDDEENQHEPVGMPQQAGGIPLPQERPSDAPAAQVNQVLSPYDTGVNPSVGAPGPNAGGMSPGKLALLQAGLGMMAASGQRDRHGLPMPALAAIGQGGMQGVHTYQAQQALAQRERAAQAALGLKQAQMQALEAHRKTTEDFARQHLELQKQRMGAGLFDDDTVNMMAEQAIAGDKSVFSNLGRGIQGPQNIERVRRRMNELAQERNMKGSDIAALNSNFTAQTAAARTAAVREANVQTAVNEAKATFPLALEASQGVSRKDFVPYNQLLKMYREKTSNPAQARLAVALQGTITAYSQAMSRTGVNTVHSQERAEHLLDDVTSHESLQAKIHQMELEMNAALKAPEQTRKAILDKISGKNPGGNLDVEDILNPGKTTDEREGRIKAEIKNPNEQVYQGRRYRLKEGMPRDEKDSWEDIGAVK